MPVSDLRRIAYRCALALVIAAGCSGDKRQNVTGVVTLDGQPLSDGIIQFYGPGDRLSTARIQPDGTFVATDVMPGDNIQVAIVDNPDGGMNQIRPPQGKMMTPPVEQAPTKTGKALVIPKKYKDFKTSGLSYTISRDTPSIEVKLLSK